MINLSKLNAGHRYFSSQRLRMTESEDDANDPVSIGTSNDEAKNSRKPRPRRGRFRNSNTENSNSLHDGVSPGGSRAYTDLFKEATKNAALYYTSITTAVTPERLYATLNFKHLPDILQLGKQAKLFARTVYIGDVQLKDMNLKMNPDINKRILADLFIYSYFKAFLYGIRKARRYETSLEGYVFDGHAELFKLIGLGDHTYIASVDPTIRYQYEFKYDDFVDAAYTMVTNSKVCAELLLLFVLDENLCIELYERLFTVLLKHKSEDVLKGIRITEGVQPVAVASYGTTVPPIGSYMWNVYPNVPTFRNVNNSIFMIRSSNPYSCDSYMFGSALRIVYSRYRDNFNKIDLKEPSGENTYFGRPKVFEEYTLGDDIDTARDLQTPAQVQFITGVGMDRGTGEEVSKDDRLYMFTGILEVIEDKTPLHEYATNRFTPAIKKFSEFLKLEIAVIKEAERTGKTDKVKSPFEVLKVLMDCKTSVLAKYYPGDIKEEETVKSKSFSNLSSDQIDILRSII